MVNSRQNRSYVKVTRRLVLHALAAAVLLTADSAARSVTITPTFDTTITSSAYASTIEADINSALSFYNNSFANPVHVNIYFETATNVGYLGQSLSTYYENTYSTYTQAMLANATAHPANAIAQTAYNNLQYGNDSNGAAPIFATSANLRALGFQNTVGQLNSVGKIGTGPGYFYDGIISLNATDLAGFGGDGAYGAKATIQHEVDEVLGIGGSGSTLGGPSQYNGTAKPPTGGYGPLDLMRYAGVHTPSYDTNPLTVSYFSIDGGATNLVTFNQTAGGDYADWGGTSTYVQQAFTGPGSTATVSLASPEGIALQAVGYNGLPSAPTLIWSPNGSSGGSDISGGWNTSSLNWTTGSGPAAWANGDNAVFGAGTTNPVTVTLQTAITAQTLTFNSGGAASGTYYSITSGGAGDTLTLTGSTVTANSNDLISAPVNFTNGLVVIGTGALTLTAANTNTVGTVLAGGTLAITQDAAVGSGGIIFAGGTLQLNNYASALTFSNEAVQLGAAIGAPASLTSVLASITDLTYEGPGVLNLTAVNTYTGATTINAGTLALSGAGSIADSSGVGLVAGATFDISQSTVSGGPVIAGLTGSAGTVALGANTLQVNVASGNTDVFGGVIQDGGVAGGTGGSLAMVGAGELDLTGVNLYTGPTSISSGTLSLIGAGSIAASSDVAMTGGVFDVSKSTIAGGPSINGLAGTGGTVALGAQSLNITVAAGTDTFAGVFADGGVGGGTGGTFTKEGSGTLQLTGASTNTGGETINAGTLAIGPGGNLGTGTLTINSSGTFSLNGTSTTVTDVVGTGAITLGGNTLTVAAPNGTADIFNGSISGTGGLTVAGAGSLTLAGASTFSGTTNVNFGSVLLLNNASALGASSIVNSGLLGNASSTYTAAIQGNFTQAGGGVLMERVGGSGSGQFDQWTVGGTSSINGNLTVAFENGYAPATSPTTLTIIHDTSAGTMSGNFSSVVLGSHPIDLFASTVDTGTDLNLVFTLHQPSLVPYALTGNQIAVAQYLDLTDGYSGGTPSAEYQALINQIDSLYSSEVPTALDQLSGIVLQVFPQVALQNSIGLDETFNQHAQALDDGASGWSQSIFALNTPGVLDSSQMALSQMLDQQSQMLTLDALPLTLPNGTQIPMAQQPQAAAANWSAFLTGALQLENYSSADSISNPKVTAEGVTLGGDYAVSSTTSVGALFAYAHNDIRLDSFGSKGSMDTYTPGVYANFHTPDGWFTDALAAYSYNGYSEHRNLSVGGISQTASGTDTGNQGDLSIDAGRQFSADNNAFNWVGPWTLIPMTSLAYTYSNFNSYAESGAGVASLNVGSMETNSLRSTISLQVLYTLQLSQSVALQPGLLIGWRHEFLNGPQGITSSLQGAGPGQSFTITTEPPSKDTGIFGGSLQATINQSVNAFVDYQIDVGSQNLVSQRVFAGVAVKF